VAWRASLRVVLDSPMVRYSRDPGSSEPLSWEDSDPRIEKARLCNAGSEGILEANRCLPLPCRRKRHRGCIAMDELQANVF